MKSKCVILRELNKPLSIEYLDVPQPKRGQVLVKVHWTGLCGSQINEIRGIKGDDKFLPHLLGHEGVGTVLDVGEGVTKVEVGDKVVLTWIKCSGLDGGPKLYGYCNAGSVTTFQEYSVVSENRLVKVWNDDCRLAMFGCMIPTGFGSVFKFYDGNTVRVFGVGGVGSAAVLAAKCLLAKVYVVDVSIDKLLYAARLGADVVNLPTDKLSKVDVAIDTTGNVKVIEQAFDTIYDNGTLVIVGNGIGRICLDPFEFIKGKKIVGSWGGNCSLENEMSKFIKIDTSKIQVIKYKLDEINKAIEEFPQTCGKILLEC